MARLFIFAVGGTGSRVLKSLTMLLAAGVKPNSEVEFEIVPIIIDPHRTNEDLKRTEDLLKSYQNIENTENVGNDNGFFGTRITTLDNLRVDGAENRLNKSFTFNLQNIADTKFSKYIKYDQMDEANNALTNILFSGKSIDKRGRAVDLLDIEMEIGFVGNPNVGSVVLNQVKNSREFREFATNFSDKDRIFIISSIFGGTGAAGFPTILKNIRNAHNDPTIDNGGFLRDAKIGAITVMPYFNVEGDENSPIKKADFIAKTKSALHYYKNSITDNNSINALYYITDDHVGQAYDNDPGDGGQQNNAHFIEKISALAIIDFLEISDENLECRNGVVANPIYKEFFTKTNNQTMTLNDFYDNTDLKISLRLSQLALFKEYLDHQLNSALEKSAWSTRLPEIDRNFIISPFYRTHLFGFMKGFGDWITELSRNDRSFSPFVLGQKDDLHNFIRNREAKKRWFKKVNYVVLNDELGKISHRQNYRSAPQKFLRLFFEATESFLTKNFNLSKEVRKEK